MVHSDILVARLKRNLHSVLTIAKHVKVAADAPAVVYRVAQ